MKGPLESCVNRCGKPPKSPSWVLCEDCLEELDAKVQRVLQGIKSPDAVNDQNGGQNEPT